MAALALALGAGAAPAAALVDPTRPTPLRAAPADFARAEAAGPRWRLQSTLVAAERRVAVINGRTVSPGATIDGATLREVRADGVVLDAAGQRVELRLRSRGKPVKQERKP